MLIIDRILEMANTLRHIGQHYFGEAKVDAKYITPIIRIENEFNEGCEEFIRLLQALKNHLQYNLCLCNTHNSC